MTLRNKPPAGRGWKLDGTGYDFTLNRREWFWFK
jgi:hypothetical protein